MNQINQSNPGDTGSPTMERLLQKIEMNPMRALPPPVSWTQKPLSVPTKVRVPKRVNTAPITSCSAMTGSRGDIHLEVPSPSGPSRPRTEYTSTTKRDRTRHSKSASDSVLQEVNVCLLCYRVVVNC